MEKHWLCLQTSPKRESELAKHLNGFRVPAYAPRYQQRVRTKYFDRIDKLPLFPSYLFAQADDYHEQKALIQRLPTKVKSRVVGDIDFDYIAEMQARETDGFIILPQSPAVKMYSDLRHDEQVKIVDGTFAGIEGVFDASRSADERIVILVSLFNKQLTPVQLHRSQVEPV